MKKKIAAILMSAVCGTTAAISAGSPCGAAEAAPAVRLMGDINGDMNVSVEDAQLTLRLYTDSLANKASAKADMVNGAADTDMDGSINIADAQNILSYYCRTLAGDQPLWAEYREVSYIDGNDHYNKDRYIVDDETGELIENPHFVYEDTVFGKTGMYLEVGCAQGAPGETVEVPVYVAGVPILAGFQFYLNQCGDAVLNDIQTDLEEMFPESDFLKNTDPKAGALVWLTQKGDNISIADGTVIGTFSYTIPEDAVSGSFYPLVIDKVDTMFVSNGSEIEGVKIFGKTTSLAAYQYTLLDGVIAVK